ncbi:MAG: hypothetical protein LUD46_11810 [Parabacteroides sp.]|nr:hypothetical protein [Parabacteroides sp.]
MRRHERPVRPLTQDRSRYGTGGRKEHQTRKRAGRLGLRRQERYADWTTMYAASWEVLSNEDPAEGVYDVPVSLSLPGKRNEGKRSKRKNGWSLPCGQNGEAALARVDVRYKRIWRSQKV